MSCKIWFDPTSDKWVLSDGEHYLEVPHWVREIIADEFERETRQLKTENDKLREQGERLFDKTLELGTDNAKLRELVKDIYVDMWALGEWLEPYEQRMRDLGIEVD